MAGEQVISSTTQVIKEYKKKDNFVQDVIKAGTYAYMIGFIDFENKVTQVFPQLDPSETFIVEATTEEGKEGEDITEGEVVEAEGPVVTKELGIEEPVVATKVPKESIVNPKARA